MNRSCRFWLLIVAQKPDCEVRLHALSRSQNSRDHTWAGRCSHACSGSFRPSAIPLLSLYFLLPYACRIRSRSDRTQASEAALKQVD